jgi:hypothetical protein
MILVVDFSKQSDKGKLFDQLKKLKPVPYRVELKVDRDSRSNNQNRYYWGVVVKLLSEHTGFSQGEMHYTLRHKFLSYTKVLSNNERVQVVQSTTDLDTKEFEDYMEDIRRFAIQELDIEIPLPNECLEI